MSEKISIPLGPEALALVRFLLQEEGKQVKAYAPGILVLSGPRPHHDARIKCVVCIDPSRWSLGAKHRPSRYKIDEIVAIAEFKLLGNKTPEGNDPANLSDFVRMTLQPRSNDINFFEAPIDVTLEEVNGVIATRTGN